MWLPCLVIYAQYVLFTRAFELIVLDVPSPQFIRIVPEVVDTENAVMVLPAAGVAKVQIVAGGSALSTETMPLSMYEIPNPRPNFGISVFITHKGLCCSKMCWKVQKILDRKKCGWLQCWNL